MAGKEFYKRILSPLRSRAQNKKKIFAFDVETYQVEDDFYRVNGKKVKCKKNIFYMGSVVSDNFKKVFYDRKEMGDFLLSRVTRDSLIFATNLEFDFEKVFFDRKSEFNPPIYRNYLIAVERRTKENGKVRKWMFLDTFNYIKCSVANLGSIVGVSKINRPSFLGRKPKNYFEIKELEEYNLTDSEITFKFAKLYQDFCTLHNIKMKLTLGSCGLDFWRRNYQDFPLKREKEDILRKHFQGAFRGGMTLVIKRGYFDDKLYYYDYRSAYPYCLTKGFDGKGSYPHPSSSNFVKKGTTELIERFEGICKASVKAPYMYLPYLSVKNDIGKLLFPYGNFEGWFTNYELRKAMNLGYEVTPKDMVYYTDSFIPFRNAVNYLYKLRKKYKLEKHPFEKMIKTIMNSGLFGKWGTNFLEMEDLIELKDIIFNDTGMPTYKGKTLYNCSVKAFKDDTFNGYLSMKKIGKPFRYSMPIFSTYTTMLGRSKLWSDISKYPDNIIYTDTDSGIFNKKVMQESDKLGGWELEYKISEAIFVKPKWYWINNNDLDIIKLKGVGRKIQTKKDFINLLLNPNVSFDRFTKIKESTKCGIDSGSIITVDKCLNVEDDKRVWEKPFTFKNNQTSEPLKI